MGGIQHKWTISDQEFVRTNFQNMTFSEIGKHIGVSKSSAKAMAKTLGCFLTDKQIHDRRAAGGAKSALENHIMNRPKYPVQKRRFLKAFEVIKYHHPEKLDELLSLIKS